MGLVYAGFALSGPRGSGGGGRGLPLRRRGSRRAAAARWCCESAPAWAKRGRDVFGDLAGALPLARELKRRFDPAGLLNPGRFAGHL